MTFNWCVIAFAIVLTIGAFWPVTFAEHGEVQELSQRLDSIEGEVSGPAGLDHRLTVIETLLAQLKEERDNDWVPKGTVGLIVAIAGERVYDQTRRRIRQEDVER